MTASSYARLAGAIFAVIALLQLARALAGWPVTDRRHDNARVAELGCLRRCRRARLARLHRPPLTAAQECRQRRLRRARPAPCSVFSHR